MGTFYKLKDDAMEQYPDKSYYWYSKYTTMKATIMRWERTYNKVGTYLMVQEELNTTRSPGKATALKEWLHNNNIEQLLTFPEFYGKVQAVFKKKG